MGGPQNRDEQRGDAKLTGSGVIEATAPNPTPSPGLDRAEFAVGSVLIVFAHLCDAVSTYISSPDLAREINPLYLKLDALGYGGWTTLLTVKAIGVAASVMMFSYYIAQRRRFYSERPGVSFAEFLHFTHGKDAVRRRDGSWVAPSVRLLGILLAFTVAVGSAAYAYCLAIGNLLLTPYLTPVVILVSDVIAPAAVFMLTAVVFWRTLYDDYRRVVGR